eukprot:c26190_g1_i4 orf=1-177(-)
MQPIYELVSDHLHPQLQLQTLGENQLNMAYITSMYEPSFALQNRGNLETYNTCFCLEII